MQAQIEQLAAIGSEQHALDEALAALQPRWQAASAALDMPPLGDDRVEAWLQEQQAAQQASWQAQETQEQALRHAQRTREVAQTACDQASAEHARQQQALAAAQAALVQSAAQQQALEAQRIDTALQIGALLDELDGVMQRPGWQDEWKEGPAHFHQQRARESAQWQAQSSACEERSATLATLAVELQALRSTQQRCSAEEQAAQAAYAAAQAARDGAAGERRALFEGRPVQEVEAALRAALEQARVTLQARRESAQQAAQQRTRAEEAYAHQRQRLASLEAAYEAAHARLQDWLAGPHAPGVTTLEQLRSLLAQPPQAIHAERAALQLLEQALASALAVLAEREAQQAAHQASAAPADPRSAAELQAALDSALAERQQAQAHAAALRLQLAQDDARRTAAQALLADIAQQQQVERRWAQLNELIGSADGKKFRNYAQQFTLDVLLGYANAHLAQLAPRYQLERINHPAQPSLGLLVRDLHMGDELRSVHSLSGGESFLVSLAMALGLASLSSNRVRVESLFIDEGFGSLDADTLRVAMDALDGLQAMGRKVGIISHVQEMTERIATRILVQPAAQGRSVVSVS